MEATRASIAGTSVPAIGMDETPEVVQIRVREMRVRA
jgi:hypothetical protein